MASPVKLKPTKEKNNFTCLLFFLLKNSSLLLPSSQNCLTLQYSDLLKTDETKATKRPPKRALSTMSHKQIMHTQCLPADATLRIEDAKLQAAIRFVGIYSPVSTTTLTKKKKIEATRRFAGQKQLSSSSCTSQHTYVSRRARTASCTEAAGRRRTVQWTQRT